MPTLTQADFTAELQINPCRYAAGVFDSLILSVDAQPGTSVGRRCSQGTPFPKNKKPAESIGGLLIFLGHLGR
ncbi:hypothetical protein [Pseudochelatococcus contaminans]|uniref:Uncharacterized protein n=1 Tax=Pseudochelatococcus contaminans TaxID=1538103 RepID=A0A7W5Z1X2_9HYPH|nr:hypothetical protein [Pseudochelatococcus contaminans]MBB3808483.1 hypothetical protein [Pseudochelatococcus contaminans]